MGRTTGGMIGSLQPDNLIARMYPPAEAFVIDLAESGIIERGTVMSLEDDGTYAVLGAGSGAASCIIADTTLEDDVTATAYRTGHFYRNGLVVADGYELTATDENNLRLAGILLSDGM